MDFNEFRFIFQYGVIESGLLCEDGSFPYPYISSIREAIEDEDYFYEDHCGEDVYVLNIKASKTAVLRGIQLPLLIALNAIVTTIQKHNHGIVVHIYPGIDETQAEIVFASTDGYIETGTE